ncbi:MAG: hypothetical protein WD135_04740 [Ferruginibacter sp.]
MSPVQSRPTPRKQNKTHAGRGFCYLVLGMVGENGYLSLNIIIIYLIVKGMLQKENLIASIIKNEGLPFYCYISS